MSFASIATAIGTGIAAATSAVGAVSGAIGGTVAGGLGALGLGTAAAPSALAAGIGSLVGNATVGSALGSGLGAATSAISGGDPGEGAAMGAIGGAVTGGLGSLAGSGSSAVGGVTGQAGSEVAAAEPSVSAITKGFATPAFDTAAKGIPGAAEVAAAEPLASGATQVAASTAPSAIAASAPKSFTGFGATADKLATETALGGAQQLYGDYQQGQANEESRRQGAQLAKEHGFGGFAGFADGGYAELHAAHGGSVHVRDGAFVIPADVVSALGNGSSKAGARYLTHLFASLERGPAPEAGNLAADRAMKRHARRSAA